MDYWGGQRVCRPPLSNYWGGLAPPVPTHMDKRYHMFLRHSHRALDKKEYLMIIRDNFLVLHRNIYGDPHLNRLDQMGQMRGHNIISFNAE